MFERVPHRDRIERAGRNVGVRQTAQVGREFTPLPQGLDHSRGKIEPLDEPAVFSHVSQEVPRPAAKIEQSSGRSKGDPALAGPRAANHDAGQGRPQGIFQVGRLRRIAVPLSQESPFQASSERSARMRPALACLNAACNRRDKTGPGCAVGRGLVKVNPQFSQRTMRKLPPVCLDSSFANRTVSCWFPQHSGQSTVSNSTGADSSGTVGAFNNRKEVAVFTRELSRGNVSANRRGNGERSGKLIQVRFRVNWDRGLPAAGNVGTSIGANVATREYCGLRHDRSVRELPLPLDGEFFRFRPATTPSGVAVTHPTVGESAAISDDRCCRAAWNRLIYH